MDRTASATGIARSYKTIFELGGVPSFAQFYDFGIFIWKMLYKGFYKPWHLVGAPTIANPNGTRQIFRLNTAKAVAAELAGLVWGEECAVDVTIDKSCPLVEPLGVFEQRSDVSLLFHKANAERSVHS